MQQRFSESYWRPKSLDYSLSIVGLLERAELETIEKPAKAECFGEAKKKILSSERTRLRKSQAIDKHWGFTRRKKIARTFATARLLIAGREKGSVVRVFNALEFQVSTNPLWVEFVDGRILLPAGSMKTALWMLRDITGMCYDTIRRALNRLKQLMLISYRSTWRGTIITVLGFHVNRTVNPYTSVEETNARELAEGLIRSIRSFQPNGKTKNRSVHPLVKAWIDEFMLTGRPPPPISLPAS